MFFGGGKGGGLAGRRLKRPCTTLTPLTPTPLAACPAEQEQVVLNLASLYELGATPASLAAKRRMGAWVAAAAGDDFDLSFTKLH